MTANRTEEFAAALNRLEGGGDLDEFVAVFADDVELSRPEMKQQTGGPSGATAFWQDYLAVFDEVHSDFGRVVDGTVGVLEWTSTGRLTGGAPINYAGVSLVDFDDAGKVSRFTTYYDTQAFAADPSL